jgi:hypothetical protein
MKRILTLSIAALLVTAMFVGFVGGVSAQSATEKPDSLPEEVDTSTVDNSTAVVILGERHEQIQPRPPEISPWVYYTEYETEYGDNTLVNPAVVAGNAIASKHDIPVFYTGKVSNEDRIIPVTQVVNQLKQHGGLDSVILVGENQNGSNKVADVFVSNEIKVKDQIYHDVDGSWKDNFSKTSKQITKRAIVHQWDSADRIILLPTTYQETGSLLAAYSTDQFDGTPVLFWEGYGSPSDIEYAQPVADYLGANLVLHKDTIIDQGTFEGTPKDTALHSVDGTTDTVFVLPKISDDEFQNRYQLQVGNPDEPEVSPLIYQVGQTGSINDSGVLIAENPGTLGSEARQKIQGIDENGTVILLDLSDSVTIAATKAAPENATVEKVNPRPHRIGLVTVGYPYGVMTSESGETGDGYYVTMTNIGFDSVPEVDNRSVTMGWQGDITSSSPSGEEDGKNWVVTYDEEVESGDSFTVSLQGDDIAVRGHPVYFDYYVLTPDGLVGSNQDNSRIPGLSQEASILVGIIVLIGVAGGGYLAYRREWYKGLVPGVSI